MGISCPLSHKKAKPSNDWDVSFTARGFTSSRNINRWVTDEDFHYNSTVGGKDHASIRWGY